MYYTTSLINKIASEYMLKLSFIKSLLYMLILIFNFNHPLKFGIEFSGLNIHVASSAIPVELFKRPE